MAELIDVERLKSIQEINKANFNSIGGIREWIDSQPTTTEAEIRAKAIDDFAEKLKESFTFTNYFEGKCFKEHIDKLAEQLKEE